MTNIGGERPKLQVTVELEVQGHSVVQRGQFLWNGFWLLDDRTLVRDWCVLRWRPTVL